MASAGWKEWKRSDMSADSGIDIADAHGAFRRAVESTTDLVTFHARGGRVLYANCAARELIGIGPDDPLPRIEMNEFFATTPGLLEEMRAGIVEHGRWSGELDVCGADLRI